MFDYQAGEKYRLTLIMVGMVGAMVGMFFSTLLLQPPDPRHTARAAGADRQRKRHAMYNEHGDMVEDPREAAAEQAGPGAVQAAGGATANGAGRGVDPAAAQASAPAAGVIPTDQAAAQKLVEQWLPTAWDLSAGSASQSQETAISYMTAECAAAYRQNVWTPDMKQSIEQSGLQSTFQYNVIRVVGTKPDGAVVVAVQGEQILQVPGKAPKSRPVNLEYLVKQTSQGMKIAGISE